MNDKYEVFEEISNLFLQLSKCFKKLSDLEVEDEEERKTIMMIMRNK